MLRRLQKRCTAVVAVALPCLCFVSSVVNQILFWMVVSHLHEDEDVSSAVLPWNDGDAVDDDVDGGGDDGGVFVVVVVRHGEVDAANRD